MYDTWSNLTSLELFCNTLFQNGTISKPVKWLLTATKPYGLTPGSNKSGTAWDKSGDWASLVHPMCPQGRKNHMINSHFEMGTFTASDNVL